MIIHLGMLEQAYADGKSTVEVAEILEAKYGVIGAFVAANLDFVGEELKELMGARIAAKLGDANKSERQLRMAGQQFANNMRERFMEFLDKKGIEKMGIPGVPTQAALKGRTNRLSLGKGPRRPSFIDTGLYQVSFRAWVEE